MSNMERMLNLCAHEDDLGRDIFEESGKVDEQDKLVNNKPSFEFTGDSII